MIGSTARVKIVWANTTSATILKTGGMARLVQCGLSMILSETR
jgi:hypothetical protein